jgi:hypothetical protein
MLATSERFKSTTDLHVCTCVTLPTLHQFQSKQKNRSKFQQYVHTYVEQKPSFQVLYVGRKRFAFTYIHMYICTVHSIHRPQEQKPVFQTVPGIDRMYICSVPIFMT